MFVHVKERIRDGAGIKAGIGWLRRNAGAQQAGLRECCAEVEPANSLPFLKVKVEFHAFRASIAVQAHIQDHGHRSDVRDSGACGEDSALSTYQRPLAMEVNLQNVREHPRIFQYRKALFLVPGTISIPLYIWRDSKQTSAARAVLSETAALPWHSHSDCASGTEPAMKCSSPKAPRMGASRPTPCSSRGTAAPKSWWRNEKKEIFVVPPVRTVNTAVSHPLREGDDEWFVGGERLSELAAEWRTYFDSVEPLKKPVVH
ncbi:hypothetical protein AC579_1042 [Pseudocercospora musae]|uniref:Uncharacterized protein n=1 Tax=Pseudocercospora musae TaxID=113226 RepID=A0A139HP24_9PEZI|nr:hypothetical protein AC579_1042 [Pseudocercospora musae]